MPAGRRPVRRLALEGRAQDLVTTHDLEEAVAQTRSIERPVEEIHAETPPGRLAVGGPHSLLLG